MRVVALVSGGKDSCYNMMQCVAAGHEIVALANLEPAEDLYEIDSYMYQTVGHDGIHMYSDAMGLPLFRRKIGGDALVQEKEYSPTEGDEVEDLFCLLTDIKAEVDFDAISVGAILSDYQRIRVENVCTRLGCVSLAYLWRRDQTELLQEMIDCGINAIIVKTASLGLDPDVHLGQTITEMKSHLIKSKKKYGINVCGEGGEYETFTLDCPLFRQAIVLDEYEKVIHSNDAFAPVGFLKLNRMHLVKKTVLSKSKSSSSASASASGPTSTPSTPLDETGQKSQGQEELQPETEKPEPEPEVTESDTEKPDTDTDELEAGGDPEEAIVQENDAESPVTPVAAEPPSQTDSPTARLSPIYLLSQSQLLEGVPVKTPLDYLSDLIECHIVDCCDGHVELCNQNHGQKEEEDEDDDVSPTEDPRHSNPMRRQSEMPSSSSTCQHRHQHSQQHPNQNQASNHHYPQNQNQPHGAVKILGRRTLTSSQSCSSILSQNQDSVISTPQEPSSVSSSTAAAKPQSTNDIEKELEESLNPLLTSHYYNSNSNSNSVTVNNSNLSSPMAPSPTPTQSFSAQPTSTTATATTPPTQSIQSSREKLYVPVSQRITQNLGGWFWIMGIHDRELLSQSKIIKKSSERQQLQHQQSISSNSSSSGPPLTPNPMKNALDSLLRILEEKDLRVSDLVSVVIYVSDMSDYAQYNKEYLTVFSNRPPVRICVEAPLPLELPVLVEALAFRNDNNTSLDCDSSTSIQRMHVQGISHWAPANIGPYSQAVWVGDILYVAGQIGLVPGSMTLVDGGARIECKLALRHISRIIKAVDSKVEMRDVVQGICYVTDAKFIEECRKEWEKRTNNAIVEYLVVTRLPRDASVEWQVWAHKHNTAFEYEETGCYIGADIKVRLIRRWSYECRCAVIVCTALICNAGARFGRSEMIEMAEYALNKLNQASDDKTQECAIRVFYRSGAINPSDIDEILGNQSSKYNVAFTIIPVCLLVKENAIISFCGVRHR